MRNLQTVLSASLIAAVLAGSDAAFSEVYEVLGNEVLEYACTKLPSEDLAADVRQDTFLFVLESREDFKGGWDGTVDHFRAWVFRVAKNRCERARCRCEHGKHLEVPIPEDPKWDRKDRSRDARELFEVKEAVEVTLAVLERASGSHAEILRLYLEELAPIEIAALLRVAEQTALNRAVAARRAFGRLYEGRHAG